MSKKKTIFFLTSRYPYPLEKGDKLRAYHQIKTLSNNYNIILCSLTKENIKNEWKNELNNYCINQYVFKLNSVLIFINTMKMIFNKKPFQIGYFYQKKIKSKVFKIIQSKNPDFIYCQLIRSTEYVKDIHNIPKTLDYMDTLSEGMFKRAKISKGLKKLLFNIEGKRLQNYENKIFDYFNNHTIISEQDRALIQHPQNKNITIIPNGIDSYFVDYKTEQINKVYDLVFVGNLNYPPNIEACLFIVNKILPQFIKNGKNIKVLLSGANPSSKLLKLKSENVTIIGWVNDIRESYSSGKVFVAPLFIGTGLQNKILEAMALNLPCVTTSLVNNAIKCNHNNNILIADNEVEFYNSINKLLCAPSFYSDVIKNAKNYVSEQYSWKKACLLIPFK